MIRDFFERDISVDAFAGGAGAATGTREATGEEVDIAINHDPLAIAVFQDNNPRTECYRADVFSVDPVKACRGRHVRHLHASPDCRDHSRAKGGAPVSASVRALANIVPVWAKAVRPDIITLENVPEFLDWGPLDEKNKRIKERRGELFSAWKAELESLGYVVEHRVLVAYHYGAPTSRKRLFLVARCDGAPICWPAPTHGSPAERKANPKLKLWRTAAECIDFNLRGRSIFGRKKSHAAATLRRVATGVMRHLVSDPRPFVVTLRNNTNSRDLDQPLTTVSAGGTHHMLVAPTLVQTSYGEREGQAPRVLDLHKPLTTVVAGGQKHAVVEALLAPWVIKHYGGVTGHGVKRPLGTVTAVDHHGLVGVTLAPEQFARKYPNATKVLPFLIAYYGDGSGKTGHRLDAPLPTVTTVERFALVTVVIDGLTYAIVDITLRMLTPRELLRAQFGRRLARGYKLDRATTTRDKVRLIGNMVVPLMQKAVLQANLGAPRPMRRAA